MRITKDHRGRTVATTQPPALDQYRRRRTVEVAVFPGGTVEPIRRDPNRGPYRCAGLAASMLRDLKSDLRMDHPGVRFERRPVD